jgi:hypothetical protein
VARLSSGLRLGEEPPISSDPDRLALISRRRGGVLIEFRNLSYDTPTPLYVGSKEQMGTGEVGIYVPGTAILQGFNKVHEITAQGRNADNTGNVVDVKGICTKNPSTK